MVFLHRYVWCSGGNYKVDAGKLNVRGVDDRGALKTTGSVLSDELGRFNRGVNSYSGKLLIPILVKESMNTNAAIC